MMLPPDFLSINPEVTTQMRGILIDWLIQVQVSDIPQTFLNSVCIASFNNNNNNKVTQGHPGIMTCFGGLFVLGFFSRFWIPCASLLSTTTTTKRLRKVIRGHDLPWLLVCSWFLYQRAQKVMGGMSEDHVEQGQVFLIPHQQTGGH